MGMFCESPVRLSVTRTFVRFTLPVLFTVMLYPITVPTVAEETFAVFVIAREGESVVGTLTDAVSGPTAPPHGYVPFAVAGLFIGAQMSD